MNRRQKIIVSVTGIFLVLLILVGLTYAFFITRIRGNNNPTSISVTTANLELIYQDEDNGDIIGKNMIIEPNSNTPIGEKTFTVTNNGNATIDNYAVIIENLAVKYVETQTVDGTLQTEGEVTSLVNGEDGEPDMKLVITCESSVEGKTCNGMDGFLPEKSGILLTNSIEENEVQTYKATLTYLEDGTNQSDDMNKTIEGRFNIIDTNNTVDIEGTVENAEDLTKVTINSEYKESVIYPDGTYRFVGVKPDIHTIRTVGSETTEIGKISVVKGESANVGTTTYNGVTIPEITITNSSRNATVNLTNTINASKPSPYIKGTLAYNLVTNRSESATDFLPAEDDYGTSYYYTGNVENNYVNYSGKCWRIVRVQGNANIKLILADKDNECDKGYSLTDETSAFIDKRGYFSSNGSLSTSIYKNTMLKESVDNFIETLDSSKLKNTTWCNDLSIASDDSYGDVLDYEDYRVSYEECINANTSNKLCVLEMRYGAGERLGYIFDSTSYDQYNVYIKDNNKEITPRLKCTTEESKVVSAGALITADEAYLSILNGISYLNTNATGDLDSYGFFEGFHTLSPAYNSMKNHYLFSFYNNEVVPKWGDEPRHVRPMINITEYATATTKADIENNGLPGTYTNPYVIK